MRKTVKTLTLGAASFNGVQFITRLETWNIPNGKGKLVPVVKMVIRDRDGKFHGATNFRQSF